MEILWIKAPAVTNQDLRLQLSETGHPSEVTVHVGWCPADLTIYERSSPNVFLFLKHQFLTRMIVTTEILKNTTLKKTFLWLFVQLIFLHWCNTWQQDTESED